MVHQECINCKTRYDIDEIIYFCKKCGDILEIKFDFKELAQTLKTSDWKTKPLSVWRYRDFMPIHETAHVVTLNEGEQLASFPTLGRRSRNKGSIR